MDLEIWLIIIIVFYKSFSDQVLGVSGIQILCFENPGYASLVPQRKPGCTWSWCLISLGWFMTSRLTCTQVIRNLYFHERWQMDNKVSHVPCKHHRVCGMRSKPGYDSNTHTNTLSSSACRMKRLQIKIWKFNAVKTTNSDFHNLKMFSDRCSHLRISKPTELSVIQVHWWLI